MNMLAEIRAAMRYGRFPGEQVVVNGRFWPMSVAPLRIRTSDTIKRHLKAAGLALPSPERDGYWVLTEKGREWLYGVSATPSQEPNP